MIEIAIVAGLILLNGVFAMSELAVVSARKALLRTMAERGKSGASSALALAENPGRFLSTVQIGITLIGVGTGAFSGATLGGMLSDILLDAGLPTAAAGALGYGGVVAIITYLSVVIGELVPKNFALRNAEAIACAVARPMSILSKIAAPAVWLLDASTRLVFRLLGQSEVAENVVTEEEIKSIVAEAAATGVIESDEQRMISSVLRLGDRTARSLMTPRTDVDLINLAHPIERITASIRQTRHARLPVADGDDDDIIGILILREVFEKGVPDTVQGIRRLVRKAEVVPDTLDALTVLERLRQSEHPLVLVHDEYGHFEGVITTSDILEAIAGLFRSDLDPGDEEDFVQREDGSWLVSGALQAETLEDRLGLELPEDRDFETVAGYVLSLMNHVPKTGETVINGAWRFEVIDMDGLRIDKVLVTATLGDLDGSEETRA